MRSRLLAFALAGAIALLDRLTKLWVQAEVTLFDRHTVIPGFFDIVHTENRGMAFGLFHDVDGPLRHAVLIGAALAILVVVSRMLWRIPVPVPREQKLLRLALALVLGGAFGNLYDRVFRGSVTDFLEMYVGRFHWPAFNIADSAITLGALLLLLDLLTRGRRAREH